MPDHLGKFKKLIPLLAIICLILIIVSASLSCSSSYSGPRLILSMEGEARSMITNNLISSKQMPNFLDFIYTDGLKAVKPVAVIIIGK
jgi:hypothetical protein